jgi:hypothetical protein
MKPLIVITGAFFITWIITIYMHAIRSSNKEMLLTAAVCDEYDRLAILHLHTLEHNFEAKMKDVAVKSYITFCGDMRKVEWSLAEERKKELNLTMEFLDTVGRTTIRARWTDDYITKILIKPSTMRIMFDAITDRKNIWLDRIQAKLDSIQEKWADQDTVEEHATQKQSYLWLWILLTVVFFAISSYYVRYETDDGLAVHFLACLILALAVCINLTGGPNCREHLNVAEN